MTFLTSRNMPLHTALNNMFRRLKIYLDRDFNNVAGNAMKEKVQETFKKNYPNSTHYDPNKVTVAQRAVNGEAQTYVDVPGITRAYHDLTIKPKLRKWLTIPMHRAAYGKKATDINDLFVVRKKDGNAFLAKKDGSGLAFMYVLAKKAFQKRNSGLMPHDDELADAIFQKLTPYIDNFLSKEINNI